MQVQPYVFWEYLIALIRRQKKTDHTTSVILLGLGPIILCIILRFFKIVNRIQKKELIISKTANRNDLWLFSHEQKIVKIFKHRRMLIQLKNYYKSTERCGLLSFTGRTTNSLTSIFSTKSIVSSVMNQFTGSSNSRSLTTSHFESLSVVVRLNSPIFKKINDIL